MGNGARHLDGGRCDALKAIHANAPDVVFLDVVFLDVEMPGMDGFEVLAGIATDARPSVVFVTAFDDYATRAFDVHAVDYLLKPFDAERFGLALARVRARRGDANGANAQRLAALLTELKSTRRYPDRLLLKDDGNVVVVLVADIDWIEAADNYIKVHARGAR